MWFFFIKISFFKRCYQPSSASEKKIESYDLNQLQNIYTSATHGNEVPKNGIFTFLECQEVSPNSSKMTGTVTLTPVKLQVRLP